ncbi:unnamed protein product [Peronospora belbahrii]|uniref:Uncharacterized protein n=1 Tax=Peronospora belbahrii TaxID=622444 RepID=A0ABN8D2N0_9STRA|nr:unnamed protein product [Peronospora belbahrii]
MLRDVRLLLVATAKVKNSRCVLEQKARTLRYPKVQYVGGKNLFVRGTIDALTKVFARHVFFRMKFSPF